MDGADLLQLEADLQSLGLAVMAEHAGEYAERAAQNNTSYVEFLRDPLAPLLHPGRQGRAQLPPQGQNKSRHPGR